jgi:hypothetical protein
MLLSENNIKAELSYAYLHAVASRAGCSVVQASRHEDGVGIDAVIRARERFAPDSMFTDFTIDIQLKSTSVAPSRDDQGRFCYELLLQNYNTLRNVDTLAQRILVVLYLPEDESHWLSHSQDGLVLQRCAYWISLHGAPEVPNKSTRTVYVPSANHFSVEGLRSILTRVSCGERISHEP